MVNMIAAGIVLFNPDKSRLNKSIKKIQEQFNKIYIFERGSQFDILREVKNSYMWVSPVPEKLRKNYNLVQKHAGFSRQMIRDVLIYKKGYQKKLYEREFIGHLKETIREMM